MGGRVSASAKRIAADRLHLAAGSKDESEFDLDEEERRIKDLKEKNKQVVTYVVENLFPYAPVSIKIQRLDDEMVDEQRVGKKKKSYLWITIDEYILKQQNVPLDTTVSYPLVVAIDSTGNAYVTDRNNTQRKLKSQDIVTLATAKTPPPPPEAVVLAEASGTSLKEGKHFLCVISSLASVQALPGHDDPQAMVDPRDQPPRLPRDPLQPGMPHGLCLPRQSPQPRGTLMEQRLSSSTSSCLTHNSQGWSEFGPVSGPFSTLAGVPEKPQPPFAAVISDSFIHVCWAPAINNGAPILAYFVEMKEVADKNAAFVEVYKGRECGYLVPGLTPKSIYIFRLKALNAVGETLWVESKPLRTKEFARPEVQELPTGGTDRWVECWDAKEEKVFYFNKWTCQRSYEVPVEVLEARKKAGAADDVESPEMAFRKKRFHFHRELRAHVPPQTAPFELTLTRATMLEDTVARFGRASKKDLMQKPRITFEGEGGIDSGGLTKDWYLQVSQLAAKKEHGLFRPLDKGLLELDPDGDSPDHLKLFRFLGKFLAKAIFDRHVVHLPLAPVLYKHLVGLAVTEADLVAMDPQFHKSLQWIRDNDVTDVLYETFSITRAHNVVVDLKENGRNVDVTEANKAEYVHLMMQWRTEFAVRPQLDAILTGMHMLLPTSALHCFEWTELDLLLNGNPTIDVDLLRANVAFQGGYDATAQVVLWLWQALRTWDNPKRQLFLKFATGSPSIPLDGFEPPFTITKSDLEPTALPRSHTCFNQLVLPEYLSFGVLTEKMTFAIQNTEGFELS
ncbi:Aste57867_13605 [Aphanomyces stellatus]|uniref:HECT-type E3 ubiquitin transferase n=1 Tax=Aphanomyces stellatus TaxID=120398 RepID=A0A485KYU0_9STRA|nr:hypothetical protein As57867_013555 [Aphanomyces stellatus]VFT90442.1 Aste57867_13605 [Aphanomyces stellatus]